MAGPGSEGTADHANRARLRVSDADREQTVEVLKVAFVQGRVTQDELDLRSGQAFTARTYSDLAVLTADLPAGIIQARPPRQRARAQPRPPGDKTVQKALRIDAAATAVMVGAWTAALLAHAENSAVGTLLIAVTFTWFGILMLTGSVMLESRLQKRPGRQIPPRPGHGGTGQTYRRLAVGPSE
jgi:Domain of unknown function (DUF1707)